MLPLLVGFLAILLLIGSLCAWSVGTQIAGAVVAPGVVEIESERQVIQHPEGGVVGEIQARDGDTVAAGSVLLRFDGTYLESELAIIEAQLIEIFVRQARLRAERDDRDEPDFSNPPDYAVTEREVVSRQVNGQRQLFAARRAALMRRSTQLTEQQRQIERQIEGLAAQLAAAEKQVTLITLELEDVQSLFDRQLVPAARLLALQREEARLQGEAGRLVSAIAEARTRISELDIQRLSLTEGRREDAIASLRDIRVSEIELVERRHGLQARLARLDVRAPVAGTIFASNVSSLNSVVRAAEPMMYIVPDDQPLQVSARIDPVHIDQVFSGQPASLVFTTFNRGSTSEVPGVIVRVSADVAVDPTTGAAKYEAIIVPDDGALALLDHVTLLPGMPVEVFLKTGDRTPLAYLTQPLTVYFSRAFREE